MLVMGLVQSIDFYDNRCLKRVRSVENVSALQFIQMKVLRLRRPEFITLSFLTHKCHHSPYSHSRVFSFTTQWSALQTAVKRCAACAQFTSKLLPMISLWRNLQLQFNPEYYTTQLTLNVQL